MKVIGLCGGSGSGKGAVSAFFAELGIPAIDTDLVYRTITSKKSECLDALVEEFGNVLLPDGGLDRRKLAEVVFSDGAESKRLALNRITHKFILDEVRRWLKDREKSGDSMAIVDAPLLFESGFDGECDVTVGVVAPIEVRVERIMARDGISRASAEARISSQLSDGDLHKLCNYIINNNGTLDTLRLEVSRVAEQIKKN